MISCPRKKIFLKAGLMNLGGVFDIEKVKGELSKFQNKMSDPDFWNNREKADAIVKKVSSLKSIAEPYEKIERSFNESCEMLELLSMENGVKEEDYKELWDDLERIEKEVSKLEFKTRMNDPDDSSNAIVSINAGAGGTEACDWASMLARMYKMWAEKNGFEISVLDVLPGDEAGIKHITFIVKGPYAFGYLKSERGVHRLVRISPFDANKRRHTSFASVDVIPEVSDDIDVEINENDLRIDTFRSSGAGGQHVNVTDSAVRITHIPTGIVVSCQNDRSQHKNKASAMKVLKARLYELERRKREEEFKQKYGQKEDIAWGSQIRSYVFHPYNMVKDLRTDYKTSNVSAVMDGELNDFIDSFLKWKSMRK